ncbi:hypothetical protein GF345_00185 [Candidatus Woesearchaeota archaeon]|nr:hypothetical protein [Candidatus Woesearchaeota archaeon]
MEARLLKEIGLTEGESKVYMALLELGTTTTGPVVKKSGISASKVYDILSKLTDKGLVSHIIKAKTKYFRPADPERILDYLDEKEKRIAEKKEQVRAYIPLLKAKLEGAEKREAEVFEGRKGIENIFYTIISDLKKGDEYYVMGASYGERQEYLYDFFEQYHKERAKRGIKVKLLFNHDVKTIVPTTKNLGEIRYMPQDVKTPTQIIIWKDNVTTITWQDKPIAFTIRNRKVAESYKAYFDSYWHQETKVVKGLDAIQNLFEEMLEAGHADFIGARGYFMDLRPKYTDDWEKRAIEKGFTMRNIVDPEVKGHRNTRMPFSQTKYTIPKEFSRLSVFWIYGNKVVISNWMQDKPIAIVIENKQLHNMYQEQFNLLWEKEIIIR